jgi:hypothetical protein
MTEPTRILTSTKYGSNIKTTLYGVVTPERLAAEQHRIDHLAETLSPQASRPRDEFRAERIAQHEEERESSTPSRRRVRKRSSFSGSYASDRD